MVIKVLLVLSLTVAALQLASAAPPRQQDLEKSFVEFLKQDKEFGQLLEKGRSIGLVGLAQTRHTRSAEAEEETFSNDAGDMDINPNKEGFFDRAAKFVMEVLQRFLKWVNTDN